MRIRLKARLQVDCKFRDRDVLGMLLIAKQGQKAGAKS